MAFARLGFAEYFYSQVCFLCQQAAEKAVKAVHYLKGEREVSGHSVHALLVKLEKDLPGSKTFFESGGLLDQYFVPARYPGALPDGAPCEIYTRDQAEQAIDFAQAIVHFAKRQFLYA